MAGPNRFEEVENEDGIPVWDIAAPDTCNSPSSLDQARHPAHTHRKSTSTTSSQELYANANGPRCSKDLYAGSTIEYKSGLDTFIFPTPSPLLRSPSPRPSPMLVSRSATFQHLPSELRREPPKIGLAIGSPSHPPPCWGRSQTSDGINGGIQQRVPSDTQPAVPRKSARGKLTKERPPGKKTSSWKLFSNIFMFRKTTKPVPTPKDACYKRNLQVPLNSSASPARTEAERLAPMVPLSARLPAPNSSATRQLHSRAPSDSQVHPRRESRGSVRTSFTRLLRAPCEETTTNSSSPWCTTSIRGENDEPNSPVLLYSHSAAISRTPRLELNLPEPELERYSVMFSQLLSPTSSNDSKPSLLERRLSRLPAATKATPKLDALETYPQCRQSQTSPRHLTRSFSMKVDERRKTPAAAAPVAAFHQPWPIARSQTEPVHETAQNLADSPRSHTGSISYSEASLPSTPITLNACNNTVTVHRMLEEKEPSWNILASQPIIMSTPDVTDPRVDDSIDLERQMVQVSVARQVSISRARSQIRRMVSTKQPQMVDLVKEKNRKSEVGILDSVDFMVDPEEEGVPDAGLIKESS